MSFGPENKPGVSNAGGELWGDPLDYVPDSALPPSRIAIYRSPAQRTWSAFVWVALAALVAWLLFGEMG